MVSGRSDVKLYTKVSSNRLKYAVSFILEIKCPFSPVMVESLMSKYLDDLSLFVDENVHLILFQFELCRSPFVKKLFQCKLALP
jgi:hypothetical protein